MIITLSDVFPVRKSYTDIVSAATDNFAAIDSKVFASLPADVQCGDVLDSTGALYTSGNDAFVVVSEFVTAGSNKPVNVLRAPNVDHTLPSRATISTQLTTQQRSAYYRRKASPLVNFSPLKQGR